MKTKHFFGLLLLSLLCINFSGCSKDNKLEGEVLEEERELLLSVGSSVDTDGLDYTFQILDGNGGYTVSVSTPNQGRARIEGNKVIVDLLAYQVLVTVTDKREKSQFVIINTSNKTLKPISFFASLYVDNTVVMKHLDFGAGEYTVEKVKGNSAEVTVDKATDNLIIKGIKLGNSHFTIKDKRGTTAPLTVSVESRFYLEGSQLDVEAVTDQTVSIVMKWGEGEWEIMDMATSPLIDRLALLPNATVDKKYDVFYIYTTTNETEKGTVPIRLKDKAGNIATITLTVK